MIEKQPPSRRHETAVRRHSGSLNTPHPISKTVGAERVRHDGRPSAAQPGRPRGLHPRFVLFVFRRRVAPPGSSDRTVTSGRGLPIVAARQEGENRSTGAQNGRVRRPALRRAALSPPLPPRLRLRRAGPAVAPRARLAGAARARRRARGADRGATTDQRKCLAAVSVCVLIRGRAPRRIARADR